MRRQCHREQQHDAGHVGKGAIKAEWVCRSVLPGVRTCAPFEVGLLRVGAPNSQVWGMMGKSWGIMETLLGIMGKFAGEIWEIMGVCGTMHAIWRG